MALAILLAHVLVNLVRQVLHGAEEFGQLGFLSVLLLSFEKLLDVDRPDYEGDLLGLLGHVAPQVVFKVLANEQPEHDVFLDMHGAATATF